MEKDEPTLKCMHKGTYVSAFLRAGIMLFNFLQLSSCKRRWLS